VICDGLSPTRLSVKDVIRRVCHKDGGEGTLTVEAENNSIPNHHVQLRCDGALLDYAKLRDEKAPE